MLDPLDPRDDVPSLSKSDGASAAQEPAPAPAIGGVCHGHLLVVDDEKIVATAVSLMLRNLGWTVTTVLEAPQALQLVETNRDRYDGIIVDYRMPGMNGETLIRALRRLGGEQAHLVLSSGLDPDSIELPPDAQPDCFLTKPYRLGQLQAVLPPSQAGQADPPSSDG